MVCCYCYYQSDSTGDKSDTFCDPNCTVACQAAQQDFASKYPNQMGHAVHWRDYSIYDWVCRTLSCAP